MKITAAILVTSHKHGTDYGLYPNEVVAYDALYDYVVQFWEDQCDGEMPEHAQDAIDLYFEQNAYHEWWEICTRTLDMSGSALRALLSDEEEIR